jgi:hypothetical protein
MKHVIYFLSGLLILPVLFSCNANSDQQAKEGEILEDSIVITSNENALPEETISFFNGTDFSSYAKSKSADIDWKNFTLTRFWTEDSMLTTTFEGDKNFFDSYGRFLKYSPDSSRFIDLDSYNVDIYKNKKGQWIGDELGPDTEVSFVDLKKNQRTRLIFLGPGNSIEDAAWLDNDNLVLMGMQENNSDTDISTVVWKFNIPSKKFSMYALKDPALGKTMKGYSLKERLKGVTIK